MPKYIARLVNSGNGQEEATYAFEAADDDEAREEAREAWAHLHVQLDREDEGETTGLDGPYVILC